MAEKVATSDERALREYKAQRYSIPPVKHGSFNLIGLLFGILKLAIVVGFFVLLFIFVTNCLKTGACQYLTNEAQFNARMGLIGVETHTNLFSRLWLIAKSGGISEIGKIDYGTIESNIDKRVSLENINLDALPQYYFNGISSDGKKVINQIGEIVTTLNVKGITEDTPVEMSCKMKGYDGKISYVFRDNPEPSENNMFIIPRNTEEDSYQIGCNFDDGVDASDNERAIDTRGVTMGITFDSNAESKWRPYILHSSVVQKLRNQGISPTKYLVNYVSADKAFVNSNGKYGMKTERAYESSEVIEISSGDGMPFQDGKTYSLFVDLQASDTFSEGNLKELKELKLTVPSTATLKMDEKNCDYIFLNNDDQGNNVYTLKRESKDRINNACKEESLQKLSISKVDCILNYLIKTRTHCRMTFDIEEIKNTPTNLKFIANAKYSYDLHKEFFITLHKIT